MFVIDAQWDPKNLLGFHDFQDPIKASESNTSPCIPCSSNLGQVMIVMCPKVSKSVQKCPKAAKSVQKWPNIRGSTGDQQGTGHLCTVDSEASRPFFSSSMLTATDATDATDAIALHGGTGKNSSSNSARSFGSLWVLAVFFLLKIVRFQTAEQHRTS